MQTIILNTLFIFFLTISLYILIRNFRVYRFQMRITDGCFGYLLGYLHQFKDDSEFSEHLDEYYEKQSIMYEMADRYSYGSMLFSFTPLKLEYWFDDDEIRFIEEGIEHKKRYGND